MVQDIRVHRNSVHILITNLNRADAEIAVILKTDHLVLRKRIILRGDVLLCGAHYNPTTFYATECYVVSLQPTHHH